jgi:hypothetical protein
MKCVVWFPQGLDQSIGSLTLEYNLPILGVLVGFLPFVESFVSEVFQENFNIIVIFLMLVDPQITFVMLSFCYVQRPNYL